MANSVEIKARAIVEQLGGRWTARGGECRCPAHKDRTPSLSVRVGSKWPLFHCFANCTNDAIVSAMLRSGINPFEGVDGERVSIAREETSASSPDMRRLASNLWRDCACVDGTIAARYLELRYIPGAASSVRFHARCPLGRGPDLRRLPALIAPVVNELGLVTVQRTFLDPENVLRKPFPKNKLVLGPPADGAIRLGMPAHHLGLAEGLEDAAAAQAITGVPTWATMGTERFARVFIPRRVRKLTVFGQNNRASRTGYAKAFDHLRAIVNEVEFCAPEGAEDWNDLAREGGRSQ